MQTRCARLLGIGVAAMLLLGGCQKDEDATPEAALLNKRWMLTEVDDFPVGASSYSFDHASFIEFRAAGNQARGLAACDVIAGRYALEAGSQQLTFPQLAATAGNCSSPRVARLYLAALRQTARYEINGRTLRLYDASAAKPRLVFEAAP